MSDSQPSQPALVRGVMVRFIGGFFALMVLFFWPAGTFAYWQAWCYMVLLFSLVGLVMFYLLKNDPALLARRMRMKEKVAGQRLIVALSFLPFLVAFALPGLDRRFGWSNVPVWLAVIAFILAFLGYGLVFLVFRENRYASRIIEVDRGQTVISSGPYATIRHPMYAGVIVMYVLSPLALGSYWAMLPALLVIPILVARILGEEKVLAQELAGYTEYMQKVRYRLLPGIW